MTARDDQRSAIESVFSVASAKGEHRFTVWGELDVVTAPLLERAVAACDLMPRERLVLDLSRVTFIDSGGLAAVAGGCRHALGTGATCVVWASRPVFRLMVVVRLVDVLPVRALDRRSPHLRSSSPPAS